MLDCTINSAMFFYKERAIILVHFLKTTDRDDCRKFSKNRAARGKINLCFAVYLLLGI